MPRKYTTRPVAVSTFLVLLAGAPARAEDDASPPAPGPLFATVGLLDGGAVRGPALPPQASELDPWAEWERINRVPSSVRDATAGDWGSLTANSAPGEATSAPAWEDPLSQPTSKTNGDWKCPVMGPLFVYGQFGGGGTQAAQQDAKAAGGAGVGCQWAPVQDAELVFRSGPSLTTTDPLRPDRLREKSEWLMEVQARWPILGKIGLEYQGTAAPALTPLDHDWMNQDIGLEAPICTGGKVRIGARHHWENVSDPKPAPDAMQLYFGLELAH